MSLDQTVKNLAAIAAAKKIIADAEKSEKANLARELVRGTAYAVDSQGVSLGYAVVPKQSAPKPNVSIDDEAVVLPWVLDLFGDSAMSMRLTEQGRKSAIEYALDMHKNGEDVDGITVTNTTPTPPTPRFTAEKNVVELVAAMVQRGELSLATLLEIDGSPA